ncbi:MAG: FG-GAP repeat protein [Candidatus Sumerlaeia bacterium]|nr:FG-GAP repeat protein [Candidatus Sumerlaeia bacterium]
MSIPEFANRAPVLAATALLALALAGLAPAQLTHPFRVDGLDGANGVRLNVRDVFGQGRLAQQLGRRLVGIGDINGDGFEDFAASMVGESAEIPVGMGWTVINRGRVYVVLGREGEWPQGVVSLGDLDASEGFHIDGRFRVSDLGVSLSGAGDVNGDGYADFLIGAWGIGSMAVDEPDQAVYLVFGRPDFPSPFSLDPLDGHNAVRFKWGLQSCGGIGDVNGDGFDDFYIPTLSAVGTVDGMIVYGHPGNWAGEVHLWDLALGTECSVVESDAQPVVTGLGDVNGDGVDDFALAFPLADSTGGSAAGAVYVIYGRPGGFGDELDLAALDGTNGFRLDGDSSGERLSTASSVGDLTHNGCNDLFMGANGFNFGNMPNRGRAVLLSHDHAGSSVFPPISSLDDLGACQIWGGAARESGSLVRLWGFDSSGRTMVLASTPGGGEPKDPTTGVGMGTAQVFLFDPSVHGCPFDLSTFDGQHGIRLEGINVNDTFGGGFSGFDFNGDGVLDIGFRAPGAYDGEGEINLVYGFDGPTSLTLRRYVAPGNPPTAGVGMLGNGSHTIPHSRLWITFGSGDDGSGGASLVTVTINRTADGLTNLPGPVAAVQWIGDWGRPGWDGAYITVKYLDSEVAGLDPTRLRLYYSETPDGPWTQSEHGFVDTRRKRVGGVVWSTGYYVLVERSPPTGDVNRDGAVTPVDAQWAFECALAACPPNADIEAGDLCPPYGVLTPADSQGVFHRFLGLAECP